MSLRDKGIEFPKGIKASLTGLYEDDWPECALADYMPVFIARNAITNYGLEGVQINIGP